MCAPLEAKGPVLRRRWTSGRADMIWFNVGQEPGSTKVLYKIWPDGGAVP